MEGRKTAWALGKERKRKDNDRCIGVEFFPPAGKVGVYFRAGI